MKSVNVADLKNRLSWYLKQVKAGEEILVRDRTTPVARIVPLVHHPDHDEDLVHLAGQGKLRMGEGALDASFWDLPAPKVPAAALKRAIEDERNGE
jgi:prevent-host-death family protein